MNDCKHRFRILEGNAQDTVLGNRARLHAVTARLQEADVAVAMAAVVAAEGEFERATKTVGRAKKELAAAMRSRGTNDRLYRTARRAHDGAREPVAPEERLH